MEAKFKKDKHYRHQLIILPRELYLNEVIGHSNPFVAQEFFLSRVFGYSSETINNLNYGEFKALIDESNDRFNNWDFETSGNITYEQIEIFVPNYKKLCELWGTEVVLNQGRKFNIEDLTSEEKLKEGNVHKVNICLNERTHEFEWSEREKRMITVYYNKYLLAHDWINGKEKVIKGILRELYPFLKEYNFMASDTEFYVSFDEFSLYVDYLYFKEKDVEKIKNRNYDYNKSYYNLSKDKEKLEEHLQFLESEEVNQFYSQMQTNS